MTASRELLQGSVRAAGAVRKRIVSIIVQSDFPMHSEHLLLFVPSPRCTRSLSHLIRLRRPRSSMTSCFASSLTQRRAFDPLMLSKTSHRLINRLNANCDAQPWNFLAELRVPPRMSPIVVRSGRMMKSPIARGAHYTPTSPHADRHLQMLGFWGRIISTFHKQARPRNFVCPSFCMAVAFLTLVPGAGSVSLLHLRGLVAHEA